jgi:ubiquinone/menaquinone biosynthesis C-methylase UbiE
MGAVLPDYVLGRTREEYARLALQARIIRPYTDRFFRAAGLAPGMRVLDLGSGVGDVAMLAADIVGPEGHVQGVDVDATVLEHARSRVAQHRFASRVTFEASPIDEYRPADQFDALVGRYVLLY